MKKIAIAAALAASFLVSACGQSAAERCMEASNPKECFQVAEAGGDINDYLLYGMAGYMISSAINGAGKRQPVIIADPHYRGYRRPIPSYQASRNYVRKSTVTKTTTKRSWLGGTKTTTKTTTSWSRPSKSSSWGSSRSFRSSRRR